MKIEIELTEEEFERLNSISILTNNTKKEYIESIVKKELYNNIYLVGGYIYDIRKNTLTLNDELIILTSSENKILNHLIANQNKYISNDELIESISLEKTMSIYSLRNLIKSIRDKTVKEIILSKNNLGYKVNIFSIN